MTPYRQPSLEALHTTLRAPVEITWSVYLNCMSPETMHIRIMNFFLNERAQEMSNQDPDAQVAFTLGMFTIQQGYLRQGREEDLFLPAPKRSTKPVHIQRKSVNVAVRRGVLSSRAKNAQMAPKTMSSPKNTATTTIRQVAHALVVFPS